MKNKIKNIGVIALVVFGMIFFIGGTIHWCSSHLSSSNLNEVKATYEKYK